MTLFEAWRAFILADGTLAAKVGSTRVYPSVLPQTPQLPAITMRRVSGTGKPTLTSCDWNDARIETTFWAEDIKEAEQMAARFRSLLNGYNGLLGGSVKMSVYSFNGPRDVYDQTSRERGIQLDTLALIDESTVS